MVKFHTSTSRLAAALLGACLVFFSLSPAVAQEGEEAAPADDAAAEEAGGESADTQQASAEAGEQLDPDDPQYWSKVRKIYTVQKRPFQKTGRFSATIYGGIIPNNIFQMHYPVGLRLDYFMLENIGLEASFSYAFSNKTDLNDTIREAETDNSIRAQSEPLIKDIQLMHGNFGLLWSPFYGKTAFYNSALNYFDMYLYAGAGVVVTQAELEHNAEPASKTKVEGALGGGLAYYFGEHGAVRADYRQFIFAKIAPPNGPGGVANPSEVSLGFSWFF